MKKDKIQEGHCQSVTGSFQSPLKHTHAHTMSTYTHTQLPDKDRGRKSHCSVLWWRLFPPTTLTASWMPVSFHQWAASPQLVLSLMNCGNPIKHTNWKKSRRMMTWFLHLIRMHPAGLLKNSILQSHYKRPVRDVQGGAVTSDLHFHCISILL